MTADERLTEVFDRGLRIGVDALTPGDRDLFRIQDFIIEYEMGGLSSYIYNRLPDMEWMRMAIEAMRRHGLQELASLLDQGAGLFVAYTDPEQQRTWGEVLRKYDPTGHLEKLDGRIRLLKNYGFDEGSIA